MKEIDICPRCGGTNTDVNDYRFTETGVIFECYCLECMSDSQSWEVFFNFDKMKKIGF